MIFWLVIGVRHHLESKVLGRMTTQHLILISTSVLWKPACVANWSLQKKLCTKFNILYVFWNLASLIFSAPLHTNRINSFWFQQGNSQTSQPIREIHEDGAVQRSKRRRLTDFFQKLLLNVNAQELLKFLWLSKVFSWDLGGQELLVLNLARKPPSHALTLRHNRATKLSRLYQGVSISRIAWGKQLRLWLRTTQLLKQLLVGNMECQSLNQEERHSYLRFLLRLVSCLQWLTVGSTSHYSALFIDFSWALPKYVEIKSQIFYSKRKSLPNL